ncbi:MAG: NADH-quinone oxidoreductase subunit F, partial [Alphaproteobacteria bacterium]|nr:NADH-quinone oxidoreductase subunit F [Alphaproteobacteria bacterium]
MSEAKVGVFGHPGAGRRKAPLAPKGRQIDPAVRAEIASLLGDRPRDRQFLIEYLHLLQDGQGCMRKAQLVALAEALRLAPVEVFEVATFYAHFTVIDEDETPPPPVTVRVCNSLVCARAGGEALLAETRARLPAKARAVASPCLGACDRAPAAAIGFAPIAPANSAAIGAAAAMQVQIALPAKAIDLAAYRASGGYRLLEACRRGERAAESVCAELEAASLRGLGGAGFPTGRKWRLVRTQPAPRYVVVNAD